MRSMPITFPVTKQCRKAAVRQRIVAGGVFLVVQAAHVWTESVLGLIPRLEMQRGLSLLQTLQRVADETPSVLYTGDLAAQLAADVRNAGGIMTAADLASYSPRIREPLRTTEMGEASLPRVFLFPKFDYFSWGKLVTCMYGEVSSFVAKFC